MSDGPRILVLGTSGAGKTTLSAKVSARLNVPHIELDSIRHGPNWTETPDPQFRAIVADVVATDRWVIDGNYTSIIRDLTLGRATCVVWIDPPLHTVMQRVIRRSLWRAVTGRVLWNGNRERMTGFLDRGHPIRWAWATHALRRANLEKTLDSRWVRLRTDHATAAWLRSLGSPAESESGKSPVSAGISAV